MLSLEASYKSKNIIFHLPTFPSNWRTIPKLITLTIEFIADIWWFIQKFFLTFSLIFSHFFHLLQQRNFFVVYAKNIFCVWKRYFCSAIEHRLIIHISSYHNNVMHKIKFISRAFLYREIFLCIFAGASDDDDMLRWCTSVVRCLP